jgi:Protein of unknown function (DUF3089)
MLGGLCASAVAAPDKWGTVWLCRPGLASNPCMSDRTTTVVDRNGASHVQKPKAPAAPAIDCFYVYPTVSRQQRDNATLEVDPEERAVAVLQASRFSTACRVFAPIYPQITLKALASGITGQEAAIAYAGLLSTWRNYLAHYNHGRGIVFIGHSQGASLLTPLIANEVDRNPALRKRLVSALLLGGNVTVLKGKTVGGSFKNIPACRGADQLGCVVAYSSFETTPPPDSNFGRVGVGLNPFKPRNAGALQVLCVNPASPAGGAAALDPYFTIGDAQLLQPRDHSLKIPSTPWVNYPNEYTARCRSAGGATWLQVTPDTSSSDLRPLVTESLGPKWGLHLYDVNLALGNLVSLVAGEASAYADARRIRSAI